MAKNGTKPRGKSADGAKSSKKANQRKQKKKLKNKGVKSKSQRASQGSK